MNRIVCMALAALALSAFGSGCCCMDRYYHGDCNRPAMWGRHGGGCQGGACDDGCTSSGCQDGACATADCGGCGSCNLCDFHPLRSLFAAINCSSGCGEFYFDEWINDPPDACDPCDNHGGYVGQRCCPPRWFLGARNTCGYTCAKNCDTSCGYGDCGTPGCTSCGHGPAHGHEVHGDVIESVPTPTPAPQMAEPTPTMARRPAKPYYKKQPTTQRAGYTQAEGKPTPAVRRTSHTSPTTAKAPIGSGVRRR